MAGYSVTFSVVDNASKNIDQINRRIAAMRAPMDRLSKQISRFVDVSGLNTIAKGFASIGRAAGSVLRTLVEIVPVLGTITGAATIAGMAKLVSSYADWSQQLTSTADSLGITTQQLQQFEDATRLAGGRASDMDAALKSLYQAQGNFLTGRGGDATLWANQLGISFKDATGNARSMADLMPEVERKVAAIKDPYDRAAAATALLGSSGEELIQTFRRSHQPLSQHLIDAQRYIELSAEQKDANQAFNEAMGRTSAAFDHLGQQIGATLAKNFTPLINKLDEFVEKHSPEIIAAVEKISDAFTQWIDGVDWGQVGEDIKGVTELLQTMLTVAEAIGKAIEKTMFMFGLTNRKFTKEDVLKNSPFYAQLTPEQQTMVRQQVGISEEEYQRGQQPQPGTSFMQHPLDWLGNRLFRSGQGNQGYRTPTGAGPAPSQQPGFGAPASVQLPGDYSWGDYGTRANNPGNMNYASWQRASGRFSYTDPHTGGAHTMAVYNTMEEGVADTYKLLQRNQEKYGKSVAGALHGWAENSYIPKLASDLGLDPNAEFDISKADPATVERLMEAQFKREGRRGSHTATGAQILGGIELARGGAPPANVPPPQVASGNVNVDITHKNPPANTSVTATASGNGVSVSPPRVEHQEMASI